MRARARVRAVRKSDRSDKNDNPANYLNRLTHDHQARMCDPISDSAPGSYLHLHKLTPGEVLLQLLRH